MEQLKKEAFALGDALTRARRRLHGFAECGFDLPKTRDFVSAALHNMGYEPKDRGKGGITAELIAKDAQAPVVLLRADMDALPLREETRLPFRAENGCAHACGHDLHTAMLLGAAAVLKGREGTLPFHVRFVFEAAEELLSGAEALLETDILTDVGAAMALHVIPALSYPTGTVLLPSPGVGAPAAAFFELSVAGKSAHVGEKERGEDALGAAIGLYGTLTEEARRVGDGFSLAIGTLYAGDAPNVVAGHARMGGTFRATDERKTKEFHEFLDRVAQKSEGVTVSLGGACPPLVNDAHLLSKVTEMLIKNGIPHLTLPKGSGAAAEDFAAFAARVPSVMLALAAGEQGHGYDRPLHHPAVLFDEDAIPHGAALYAMGALALGAALRP